jgi:hypothetical protein
MSFITELPVKVNASQRRGAQALAGFSLQKFLDTLRLDLSLGTFLTCGRLKPALRQYPPRRGA